MRFLLRLDFFVDAMELFLNAFYLISRGFCMLVIQLRGCARQPPLRASHNRHHHLQIAQ
jgi:hypothetical protein